LGLLHKRGRSQGEGPGPPPAACQMHTVPASPNRVFRGTSPEYQNTRIPHKTKRYSGFFVQKRHLRQGTGNFCDARRLRRQPLGRPPPLRTEIRQPSPLYPRKAERAQRRGGSGGGNGSVCSGIGGRGFGRVGCSGSAASVGSLVRGRAGISHRGVGSSASKITRARNQKRPGTSGGGRNLEGEAAQETPSAGKGPQTRCIAFGKGSHRRNRAGGDPNPIRRWVVFPRGLAHEPPPFVRKWRCERLGRTHVVAILGSTGAGSPWSTPLTRPGAGFGGWAWKCQGSIAASEARTP
jgi:hypothetical protein